MLFRLFISIQFYSDNSMVPLPPIQCCRGAVICVVLEIRKAPLCERKGNCFQENRKPITLEVLLTNQSNCLLENGTVCC